LGQIRIYLGLGSYSNLVAQKFEIKAFSKFYTVLLDIIVLFNYLQFCRKRKNLSCTVIIIFT